MHKKNIYFVWTVLYILWIWLTQQFEHIAHGIKQLQPVVVHFIHAVIIIELRQTQFKIQKIGDCVSHHSFDALMQDAIHDARRNLQCKTQLYNKVCCIFKFCKNDKIYIIYMFSTFHELIYNINFFI